MEVNTPVLEEVKTTGNDVVNADAGTIHTDTAPTQYSEEDMPDDVLARILEKKTGRKIKSLDELKPEPAKPSKEDIAKEEEEITKEAHAWAFGTGKIKKEHFEEAIKEKSKAARDISFSNFSKEMKEDDSSLDDSDIEEMYKDAYHEDLPDDSPLRKVALKKIGKEVAEHLAKYKDVDAVVDDYKSYKTGVDRQKSYKKTVKEVVEALPKEKIVPITFTNAEGKEEVKNYTIPFDEEVYGKILKKYDNANAYFGYGLDKPDVKIDKEFLQNEFNHQLESLSQEKVIKEVVSQHEKFIEAHLKGIAGRSGRPSVSDILHTEKPPMQESEFSKHQDKNRQTFKI